MVRELFVMAREHAPSIIFMDEIDSIGSSRIESGSGGDSEVRHKFVVIGINLVTPIVTSVFQVQRTMLELLNQLDGFEATKNIKVIMATNRIDILDQALLRPGRIDRKIEFPPPNEEARLDILKIHSRKMNLTRGINLRKIAELMPGASGAEVKVIRFVWPVYCASDSEAKNKLYHCRVCVRRRVCTLFENVVFTSHKKTLKWQ